MHTTYWLKGRWISRFDVISALGRLFKTRGNRLNGAVAFAERLVIMHKLVK
jgi:hypothetical protein